MKQKQVFQTTSTTRWLGFKWSGRFLLLLVPIAALLVIFALKNDKIPLFPPLKDFRQVLETPTSNLPTNSKLAKNYKTFRQYISQRELTNKTPYKGKVKPGFRDLGSQNACGIRAGFYVNWDKASFTSLQRNIQKLNLVIPEWLFIDPVADTLTASIDDKALAIMRNAGVNIMPIVSNAWSKDHQFHGESIRRIIADKTKKERLINDLVSLLTKYKFTGVNIDFEELQLQSRAQMTAFQKELYAAMHAKGFLISQDVIPFNDDYDYSELAANNDYLFIMAYDQYSQSTKAGSICDQKWIEAAVDAALKKLPAEKTILALAAYGYDWPREENKEEDVAVLTYKTALSVAKESQAKIDFDNDTYNLHYSYYDDDELIHDVYFTDAATTFNAMRFATDAEMAGVALWRLGSEDERTWNFYNRNMQKDSIRDFDFSTFENLQASENVAYNGYGEVLDVLATPHKGSIETEIDSTDILISEELYNNLPTSFMAKKYGWNGNDTIRNKKKLVLTFDDGPDPTWTPRILDILSEKHVPASFYIVGLNAERNIPIVKRIYREGHEIGNHTFTHPNIAEVSRKRAVIEMETTRLLIECITGHSTVLFRAPFNADFAPEKLEELLPVAIARTKNYLDVGESIDPLDWEPGVSADTIFRRVVQRKAEIEETQKDVTGGNIILLHDAGGNTREATIKALPKIIDYYKERGYTFCTVADLLGKKREDVMPAVPRDSGYYLLQANYIVAETVYYFAHVLFPLFILFIILSIARIAIMAVLATLQKKNEKKTGVMLPMMSTSPLVSIIVPAYNEEVNAVSSLNNLLKTDYPNFEIIFIDDGSTDKTYSIVSEAFRGHPKVKVLTKSNGGKASALNYGISQSPAEYVVCIDADTKLKPDAVSQLVKHLLPTGSETTLKPRKGFGAYVASAKSNGPVGAVAGNVKVGNEINMLTRWQAIEYIGSQNFDRRALAYLNAITVVPGAIGAFRKSAIEAAGGFTTDTLAEDCDLTIRIIRAGYLVRNENAALAYTEAPEKVSAFMKQRFRWSFGVLQTFWKHRDIFLNPRYGWLGCLAMPNIILFQYIIPAFIPLADLFMIVGLLTGNASNIVPYYVIFMIFDALIALVAFRMERESVGRLIWIIPQRLIYRWLMWLILFRSVRRAFKGELQAWGVLKRTGRVKELETV